MHGVASSIVPGTARAGTRLSPDWAFRAFFTVMNPLAPLLTGIADGAAASSSFGIARRWSAWRRVSAAVATASVVALAAGCGDGYDDRYGGCDPYLYPAVAVRFVYALDLQPVAVAAVGTAFDGRNVEEMTSPEPGYSVDGRTSVLEAGFGRPGVYDVSVQTASGERFDWVGVRVAGDACGPFTVELEAPVRSP
jgi:hypothetical protein